MAQPAFATTTESGLTPSLPSVSTLVRDGSQQNATGCVGRAVTEQDCYARFTDEDREIAIHRAGAALIAAMGRREAARRRYEASSFLIDKAAEDAADLDARRALDFMARLIKGRSAAAVAQMERELGLV